MPHREQRALGLCRVSLPEQARGISPEAQADHVAGIAEQYNVRLDQEDIIFDAGYQGDDFDRPAIHKALAAIRRGTHTALIFSHIDRMSRSVERGLAFVRQVQEAGGRVITGDMGWLDGDVNLMVAIKLALSENEKRDIRRRVKSATDRLAREGKMCGGRPRFGYQLTPDGYGWLIHPEHSVLLKEMIFEPIAAGASLRGVCRALRALNLTYTTKSGKVLPLEWSTSGLCDILHNEGYRDGWRTYGKAKLVEPKKHRKDPLELHNKRTHRQLQPKTAVTHLAVPPIISRQLFAAAQKALERMREISRGRKPKCPESLNLFRGLIRCGLCGRRAQLIPDRGSKLRRYRCAYHNFELTKDCKNPSIRMDRIEAAVLGGIRETFANLPLLHKTLKAQAQMEFNDDPAEHKRKREAIDRLRASELSARRKALEHASDHELEEFYEAEAARLTSERKAAELQFGVMQIRTIEPEVLKELAAAIPEQWDVMERGDQRKVIELLVEEIRFKDGTDVEIDLRMYSNTKTLGDTYNCTARPAVSNNYMLYTVHKKIVAA